MKRALILKIAAGLALVGLLVMVARFTPGGRYLSLPGLLLILLGTTAAAGLCHSFRSVWQLIRHLPAELRLETVDPDAELERLLRIAEWHRLGHIRSAEQGLRRLTEPLLREGAELVLNRTPPAELQRLVQWKIGARREVDQERIKIVRTMAMFAPAVGMIGTLAGLIEMMSALDASKLHHMGAAMGFALLTTLYGLVFANVVLKPIAARLEFHSRQRLAWLHVQAETIRLLSDRCHPRLIQDYWRTFLGQSAEASDDEPPALSDSRAAA